MKKLLIAIPLSVALLTPTFLMAQDHDDHHDRDDHHRYYDKRHKDYHEWNNNEDKAWRIYLQDQHRAYVDWNRANAREQESYWDWRHNHSDAILQINVR